MRIELHQPKDLPWLRKDIEELERRGYPVIRHSEHHFKIGDINYWPSKGKIVIDPCTKHSEKGFQALLDLLASRRREGMQVLDL